MPDRRWSEQSRYGASHDWDASMQQAVQHESVEVLRHQIEVERERKANMERGDFFWALGIVAGAFGFGLGVGALDPVVVPKWLKKRRRKRGRKQ